jgi:hypothetical protein
MVPGYSMLLGSIRSDFNISTLTISVASAANHTVFFPALLVKWLSKVDGLRDTAKWWGFEHVMQPRSPHYDLIAGA